MGLEIRGDDPQWVLVTLKDGTRFAGFCGTGSFMSSDPAGGGEEGIKTCSTECDRIKRAPIVL